MAKAGWTQIDSTPPLGLPMGGRGPRFSPGTEVIDRLVAQAVVLEDAKGAPTLWLSIDMIKNQSRPSLSSHPPTVGCLPPLFTVKRPIGNADI